MCVCVRVRVLCVRARECAYESITPDEAADVALQYKDRKLLGRSLRRAWCKTIFDTPTRHDARTRHGMITSHDTITCQEMMTCHNIIWPKQVYLTRLEKFVPNPPPRHRPRKSTQVTTSMEDLALYNQGYKALSLLITILASVAMNRLLSRGPRESGNRPAPIDRCSRRSRGGGKGTNFSSRVRYTCLGHIMCFC